MDIRAFRTALEGHGISRDVGDAIIDYVDEQKFDLVTADKFQSEMQALRADIRLEISELRGDLKTDMSDLRTDFANLKADLSKLVYGLGGVISFLIVAMRFLPAVG